MWYLESLLFKRVQGSFEVQNLWREVLQVSYRPLLLMHLTCKFFLNKTNLCSEPVYILFLCANFNIMCIMQMQVNEQRSSFHCCDGVYQLPVAILNGQ
jgi:hypothetical protein